MHGSMRAIGNLCALGMAVATLNACVSTDHRAEQDACGAFGPNNNVARVVALDGVGLLAAIPGFRHAGDFAAAGPIVAVVFQDPADIRLDAELVDDVTSSRFTFPSPTHDDWSEVNITGLVCVYAGGRPYFYDNVGAGSP